MSIRGQHVVNVVVDPFKREKRSLFVSLRRMVKYDIQNHFDPVLVQLTDQLF